MIRCIKASQFRCAREALLTWFSNRARLNEHVCVKKSHLMSLPVLTQSHLNTNKLDRLANDCFASVRVWTMLYDATSFSFEALLRASRSLMRWNQCHEYCHLRNLSNSVELAYRSSQSCNLIMVTRCYFGVSYKLILKLFRVWRYTLGTSPFVFYLQTSRLGSRCI